VVRQAVARFATRSIVAMFVLALGMIFMSERIARDVALDDATYRSSSIARGLSASIDDGVRSGNERALERVADSLSPALNSGTLSHVKLWAQDGTILWADDPELVGQRFDLERDVADLFGTRDVVADLSELERAENAGERAAGELLEVYVGAFDANGRPWVFESYLSTEQMESNRTTILSGMLPLALGGILLLQITVLPLAVSLARRVQRAQAERGKLLRHALLASELERRRIAAELHDGVIQDLAGLSYALPLIAEHLPKGPEAAGARRALEEVSGVLAHDVPLLRSMLTEIYPPNLDEDDGLLTAVEELALRAEDSGTTVTVHVSEHFTAPSEATRLAYRVVREGLRNVVKHAAGSVAQVYLIRHEDEVTVRVVDDGPGLSEERMDTPGHIGLRLLEDTVRDLGGRFDLSSAASGGTVLEAVFPAELARV
jgi:signal transduction histidine kinase